MTSTDSELTKQRSRIRHLLEEAAGSGRGYLIDANLIDQLSSRTAAALIEALETLKTRAR